MNIIRKITKTFISPDIFISLKDEKGWWRGLVCLLLTMLITYGLIFAVKLPNQTQKIAKWVSWFNESIQGIDYNPEEESIIYKTDHKLPYRAEKEDFSLIISKQDHNPLDNRTPAGVIFTPKKITLWLTQADQKVIVPVVQDGKIMDNVKVEDFFKDTGFIKPDFFSSFAYASIIIYALATVMSNFIYIILTTLFIIFVRRLINGKNERYNFVNMFNLYCYIGIPPMTLAAIYSSLPNSGFDFSLTYMIALFCFITFVVRKPLLSTYKKTNEQ